MEKMAVRKIGWETDENDYGWYLMTSSVISSVEILDPANTELIYFMIPWF